MFLMPFSIQLLCGGIVKLMKYYVALIANRHDTYDRYWVRSTPNETLEAFTKRMHKCYDYLSYYVDICEAEEVNL